MALDFSSLKKNSKLSSSSLAKKAQETAAGSNFQKDERFWQCEQDKSGVGEATIRFLDSPAGEDLPWIKYYRHSFKGPTGKYYIENSLTSIDQPDPVFELNQKEWVDNDKAIQDKIRPRSRKTTYVSNILVIRDKANPENEGKVFLFSYGKTIFEKINAAMNPQYEGEIPFVPFNFWEGANFKLRIVRKDGFPNYDDSKFDAPSPLFGGDDEKIEEIWKKEYSLQEFLDPKNYKTYEQLKKRLDLVLAKDVSKHKDESEKSEEIEEKEVIKKEELSKPEIKEESPKEKAVYGEDDDDDDIPDYFESLKNKKS